MRNDEFIYQLKMANPIETVFSSYVNITRKGRNYSCLCPFHSEKTASCTIYTDTQSFYCFGCGAGGDVISFIRKIENLDFPEAVKLLAQRSGLEIPTSNYDERDAMRKRRIYQANREAGNYFYLNLINGNDKRGLQYFIDRKLTPQTIKKYGLGFASNSWDGLYNHMKSKGFKDSELIDAWLCAKSEKTGKLYDIFRNRVIFPIIDLSGNVIAFGGRVLDDSKPKYLNTNKTAVFEKGGSLFSLNFTKNSSDKKLILTEGYMDVITLNQAGFENSVATLGTAITHNHAKLMQKQHCEEVIICYDSDSAGQTASQKAINIFSKVGLPARIIKMDGAKDPDEYIKKFGASRFRRLLLDSTDANRFMLEKCKDGLDMNTDQGKINFVKRAVKFLSNLEDEIARDKYISNTATMSEIAKDVIKNQVDAEIKKEKDVETKHEYNNVTTTYKKEKLNLQATICHKESKAEEQVILYLMRNPENCEFISQKLPPDIFVTEFNKKAYSLIIEKMKNNQYFTISMLSEDFSVEELGKITGIEAKNRGIEVNEKVLDDCKVVLETYHKLSAINQAENIDDETLSEMFKRKAQKK